MLTPGKHPGIPVFYTDLWRQRLDKRCRLGVHVAHRSIVISECAICTSSSADFHSSFTTSNNLSILDWRRPPYPVDTADYATYVQIVSWFLDTPSPEAPFSIHGIALAGKVLGKDVEQWFGPSTAAGAIKCIYILRPCFLFYLLTVSRTLVQAFPEAGLGVAVAHDQGVPVRRASHVNSSGDTYHFPAKKCSRTCIHPLILTSTEDRLH